MPSRHRRAQVRKLWEAEREAAYRNSPPIPLCVALWLWPCSVPAAIALRRQSALVFIGFRAKMTVSMMGMGSPDNRRRGR